MANEELTGLVVKIRADLSDYVLKLSQMEQQSDKTTKTVSGGFEKLNMVFTRVGIGVTAFAAMAIKSASDWGNAVDDLSDKTGMSGEEASKLLSMAKATGVTVDEANGIFAKFSKTVYSAADAYSKAAASGKESTDVLTNLGVSALSADGSMKSTLDIFMDVKNALNGMEDGWQKTAYEMQLFGKSGYEMHDMLNMTDEEIKKVIAKAQALGLVISSETAAGWEKFERQLKGTKGLMTSVGITIGNEMLPKMNDLLGKTQDIVKAFIAWKEANPQLASNLYNVAEAIGAVALAIKGVSVAAAKVPAWAVPSLGVGSVVAGAAYIGSKISETEGAKGAAENALELWGVNSNQQQSTIGRYRDSEVIADPEPLPPMKTGTTDTFLGGGGGGDTRSAYEKYKQDTSDLIAMWGKQVQMETLSRSQFAENVQERLTGLSQVAVATKEVTDRDALQADLQLKVNEINQESHSKAIERAEQNLALGKINEQQYISIIEQQRMLATGTEEQMALEVKLKQVKSEAAQKDLEAKNQIENTLRESEARMNAFYQSIGQAQAQQAIRLIEAEEGSSSIIESQLEIKRQTVEKLRQVWEQEAALLTKYLSGEIKVSETAYEQQKAKTEALRVAYKNAVDGMAVEAVSAAKQTSDAWANNLADIISGTATAHDILKQQWKAFVAEVLKQQLKISASSNVFNSLLGGVFGLNKTKTPEFTLDPVTVVAGARASGGPVEAGKAYLVGEHRAEVFVPRVNGEILPDVSLYTGRGSYQNQGGSVSNGVPDIKVNVVNNTGTQATPKVSQQYDSQLKSFIIDVTLDGVTRNVNGMRDAIKGAARG